eukprot:Lankesteria_metandrocarpae@DN8470_c0_g1_i1.p1
MWISCLLLICLFGDLSGIACIKLASTRTAEDAALSSSNVLNSSIDFVGAVLDSKLQDGVLQSNASTCSITSHRKRSSLAGFNLGVVRFTKSLIVSPEKQQFLQDVQERLPSELLEKMETSAVVFNSKTGQLLRLAPVVMNNSSGSTGVVIKVGSQTWAVAWDVELKFYPMHMGGVLGDPSAYRVVIQPMFYSKLLGVARMTEVVCKFDNYYVLRTKLPPVTDDNVNNFTSYSLVVRPLGCTTV